MEPPVANKQKLGRVITPAEPMTPLMIPTSHAELFQARLDLALSVAWMSGFDLHPQTIAAVDVGLQNFHLMVAHLIDHRSLQFDAQPRRALEMKSRE
jgi:hypothetical protein